MTYNQESALLHRRIRRHKLVFLLLLFVGGCGMLAGAILMRKAME